MRISTIQPDLKYDQTPNLNATTKQHAIVNIQLNIVARPTYPYKFTRVNVDAPFLYNCRATWSMWAMIRHAAIGSQSLPRRLVELVTPYIGSGKTHRLHSSACYRLKLMRTDAAAAAAAALPWREHL